MDYPVLAGCGLTSLDAAKILPLVLLVCQRGCKQSTNLLHKPTGLSPVPTLVDLKYSELHSCRNPGFHASTFETMGCSGEKGEFNPLNRR